MKKKAKLSPATFINSKLTATISIALVLFLLGLVITLSLIANKLSNYVKETLTFDIVLQDNMTESQMKDLQRKLEQAPFAKSTIYISKEEAIKKLEIELGQNPEEFLGFNPLPAIIEVRLNAQYANLDSLIVIESQISSFSNEIKEVEYRKPLLHLLNENIAKIGFVLLLIAIPLLLISFALISNTIQLMIYSKRFLIYTMQLVGAKKGFIRKPFIQSNIISGILAAIIASGLLYWLLHYILNDLPTTQTEIFGIHSMLIVFVLVLVLGVVISVVATFLAVNKYVGADINDLHKM
jgi:cell division transport system permease protein